MSELLKAALYYAGLGWRIFPLAPGQKTPMTAHGCRDATVSEDQIQEWWSKWPTANIGLACGPCSGVYVLDIDVKDGINGFDSLREFPSLPSTVKQDTPSGGVHYLYRAVLAPANRNSFRPGIDIRCDGYYIVLPPSTHPNGGRYDWSAGSAPWDRELSEFPEFMRPATRVPWQTLNKDHTAVQLTAPVIRTDVLKRAGAYLESCDPAIQGQCGHNKLLYAASRLVHGFLLSDSQAYDLLAREYNPRCVPPWDLSVQKEEKDFRRKILEARKLQPTNPEGWLLNEPGYGNNLACGIDVALLCKATIKQDTVNVPPEQEYQFLIRPTGLLGEICSWINSTAIKEQPFLSLACSLAYLGTLFGRKVRDELGSRTNLYCMGVAPSSAGKAHAMNQIRRLASVSGATTLIGGSDIASDSSIEERISREPATLFLWDEIGHLLSHIKSGISTHHAQVVSLLMKLYSASGNIYLGKEYAEREKQRNIVQPCCCIYGTSTMERFTAGISPMELQDGWLSRCLVFHAPYDTPKKRGRIECDVPKSLIDKVSPWARRIIPGGDPSLISTFVGNHNQAQPPTQIVVPTTKEAENIFVAFDNESIEFGKNNPLLACLWAKAEENARRIALIVSCGVSFSDPCIDISSADYSCRLVRYLLLDFGGTIAPEIVTGESDGLKRRLLKSIGKLGIKGATQSDITRATQDIRRDIRVRCLDDLVESGELAILVDTITKKKTYWTAEQFAKRSCK